MIDEERVKELYHLAVYDKNREEECRPSGKYFIWDYVGKECIKSFFSGSLAFILLVIFAALASLSEITTFLNNVNLVALAVRVLILYVVFMAIYLMATILIYCIRYVYRRKELRGYMNHLRRVRKMYRDEGK
jgi:type III secretory pathway component EscU